MRTDDDGRAELELADLIRINQLVRMSIDFAGFQNWYESLSAPEQAALIIGLAELAWQAGYDAALWQEALGEAGLDAGDPLIARQTFPTYGWLSHLAGHERALVLRKYVYVFGKAEGAAYRREVKEACNHWWHRNLLDERVVRAILNDPLYARTAMKDDDGL